MMKLKYELPRELADFQRLPAWKREYYAKDSAGNLRLQFEEPGRLTVEERGIVERARMGASAEVASLLRIIDRLAKINAAGGGADTGGARS